MAPSRKKRIETAEEQPSSSSPSSSASELVEADESSNNELPSDLEAHDDTSRPKKRRRVSLSSEATSSPPPSHPHPSMQQSFTTSAFPTMSRIKKKQPQDTNGAQSQTSEPVPVTSQDARDLGVQVADSTFASLNVAPWLVKSLSTMAIRRPTAIQKACIPELLNGRDCIGGSRTGSGKTVAFAVPILQKWAEDPFGTFAVVLTPTRELALQIFEQFKAISAPQNLKPVLITGGTEMRPQAIALSQRPHVVIATPGRLADLIQTAGEDTVQSLTRVRMVVLDEADRLLSGGPGSMLPDVEICLSKLPPSHSRQTLLFTATVTPEVRALKSMPRPPGRPPIFVTEINTEDQASIPPTLKQTYLQTPMTHREAFLHILLSTEGNSSKPVIIFCNRTKTADLLERMLRRLSHRVTSLHSLLPQSERISNLSRFRASAARILVATDVASRGLDIPSVSLVINFDVPRNPDDYVHRVGRTARAGRQGEAITLVGQRDVELILAIEKRVGRQMVEWEEEGVSVEGRVIRTGALKEVGEAKREALGEIEEGRDVLGRRVTKLKKVR